VGRCAGQEPIENSLKAGDIIHAINGTKLSSIADIRAAIAKLASGSGVVLTIERQRKFEFIVSEVN
jgi:S1-C subfamily serine protease